METSPERVFLEDLERSLESGAAQEPDAALSLIASRDVELDEDELRGARRRAMQLLATGGDPRRGEGLELEGRAVEALAEDLDDLARREALAAGLARLRRTADGLPRVIERIDGLTADPRFAWRWFACILLAEELADD
ncbi:MAG: hypothetical protein H0V11_02350 [Actinobacteria bacterium]|nr:hypothetical protein [Actinomycetota bacterium]